MNEEYLRKMPLRLRLIDGVIKRHERLQRKKSKGLTKVDISFTSSNGEWFKQKPYGSEISFMDTSDEDECCKKSGTVKKQSTKTKNTGSVKSLKTTDMTDQETSTPVSLSNIRQNFLYKFLWMLVNIFSISVSIYFIKTAFDDWQSSPIVQAVSNNQVFYENISFPAVTICWPHKFNKDYEFDKNIENCLDCKEDKCAMKNETCNINDMLTLWLASILCNKHFQLYPLPKEFYDILNRSTNFRIDGHEFNMYMERLLPSCENDLLGMQFGRELYKVTRCDGRVFQQFYSRRLNGLCMTYNGLRHEDIYKDEVVTPMELSKWSPKRVLPLREQRVWSFDNMMDFKGGLDTVPVYSLHSLDIYLLREENVYHNKCETLDSNIASIIIHSPNEIPILERIHVDNFVHANSFTTFLFEPKITLARDLDHYSPEQRGCLFSHEKEMTMFKSYSKNNCYIECFVDIYIKTCGCVPYIFPRPNGSVSVCLSNCNLPLYKCECLPDCNFLKYEVTTQEASAASFVGKSGLLGAIEVRPKLGIYYITLRYSIMTGAQFLTYCLGVLGAFLGFSVTCMWDVLYIGSVKIWNHSKAKRSSAIFPLKTN